ncbi:MAG TPA: TatD family hydrolase [Chiayiivirga sp.]|nr:TatD family hydrolase [Chiayiivirga sp.]
MSLTDSHCHIDAPEFDADRAELLARAAAAGVTRIIAPAISAAGWPRLREIARAFPQVAPAWGLHPMYLAEHRPEHIAHLREWVERERPVAIGECGLDFFVAGLDPDTQREFLIGQLRLAREFDLPVILHARRAVDEVTALLRRIGGLRGVVHSFSGSRQQAETLCGMGFLLGIGGPVTYDRANRLRSLAATLPISHLLLETDAPDQPDSAIRGQRNEPARLRAIAEAIAELRGETVEHVVRQTATNAAALFNLPGTASQV